MMTAEDKELLLQFVVRISMYIHPVTADTAVSFLHGYEAGIRNWDITEQLRQLLSNKYKLSYSNDGWPGQIKRLAAKRSATWITTFQNLVLELLALQEGGSLSEQQQAFLKKRISTLIERLDLEGADSILDYRVRDWLALCQVKATWFKELWTAAEWKTIRKWDRLVQAQARATTTRSDW